MSTKKSKKSSLEQFTGLKVDDLAQWVLFYPIDYAHTLMKVGYEPILPSPEYWFGTTWLALPNTFTYVKYLIKQDGFQGIYRGFTPSICSNLVKTVIVHQLKQNYADDNHNNPDFNNDQDEPAISPRNRYLLANPLKLSSSSSPPELSELAVSTGRQMMFVSIGTMASHPFHVLSVRMMAQVVGRETKYASIWESVKAILDEHGIFGFLKGFTPRLISENLKIIIPAAIFYLSARCSGNIRPLVNTATSITKLIAEKYTYQFDVVSATMIVENSSMAVGRSPFISRKFTGWFDMWEYLQELGIKNRGRSYLFRYYYGPVVNLNDEIKPVRVYFGEIMRQSEL